MMRKITTLALLFIAVAACGSVARAADECRVGEKAIEKAGGYGRAVEAAVRRAPGCERAYGILAACQLGSSGDNALADIVRAKCEPLFKGNAGSATMAAYKKEQDRCNTIAEDNEGTVYQGLAAVCQAKAARDFARTYAKGR